MTRRGIGTHRRLVRVRRALLLLTVLALATSALAFAGTAARIDELRDRTVPGVLDVTSARAALVEAHSAAVDSFRGGGARLVGPGEEYETGIAVANQDLARAAEHNTAGDEGSRQLQLVTGLLTAYNEWMSEASTQLRTPGGEERSGTDLWYASRLLLGQDQVLQHLDALAADQQSQLDHQLSSGWFAPVTTAVWAVPVFALLILLAWTQLVLRRRFRRHFNEWLLAATVLVLGLAGAASAGLVLAAETGSAADSLRDYVRSADQDVRSVAADGETKLIELVHTQCDPHGPQACGQTLPATGPVSEAATGGPSAASATAVTAGFARAGEPVWLLWLIPVLAVAAGACALAGLQPRIDEYRYRP